MPHKDPEARKAYYKAYHAARYLRKKKEINERNKAWNADNIDKARLNSYRARLKREYNMTWEDYLALFEKQNGLCAICFTSTPGGRSGMLHVDHDHDTGEVRGLLCMNCNGGIGRLRDDQDILWSAIEYLHAPPASS